MSFLVLFTYMKFQTTGHPGISNDTGIQDRIKKQILPDVKERLDMDTQILCETNPFPHRS